jgi:hypothetical protein
MEVPPAAMHASSIQMPRLSSACPACHTHRAVTHVPHVLRGSHKLGNGHLALEALPGCRGEGEQPGKVAERVDKRGQDDLEALG